MTYESAIKSLKTLGVIRVVESSRPSDASKTPKLSVFYNTSEDLVDYLILDAMMSICSAIYSIQDRSAITGSINISHENHSITLNGEYLEKPDRTTEKKIISFWLSVESGVRLQTQRRLNDTYCARNTMEFYMNFTKDRFQKRLQKDSDLPQSVIDYLRRYKDDQLNKKYSLSEINTLMSQQFRMLREEKRLEGLLNP